jgi:hypothetical protein
MLGNNSLSGKFGTMHEFNSHNSMMLVQSPKQHQFTRFLGNEELTHSFPRNQLIQDEKNHYDDVSSYRPKYE